MNKSNKPIPQHIADFLDYLEIERGLANKSQENYKRFINRFISWLKVNKLEKTLPHELTADHIWNYRVFLSRGTKSRKSKENLKKSTQNYYLIALRGLLKYFTERDILSLPAEKIKLAKDKKERTVHFLNLEQVEKLIAAPDISTDIGSRDRALLETLFSTGLRVAELAALNREQLKIKAKTDLFELTIIGKGGAPRIVYFSKRCLDWLKKYLNTRTDIDKALFINYKKGAENAEERRLTVRSIENIVKKYSKLAGLSLLTTPHTLRHSYATDLLTQGVDLRLVQEFLGHKNIATTQIYTHVTNKKLREVYLKHHSGNKEKMA